MVPLCLCSYFCAKKLNSALKDCFFFFFGYMLHIFVGYLYHRQTENRASHKSLTQYTGVCVCFLDEIGYLLTPFTYVGIKEQSYFYLKEITR